MNKKLNLYQHMLICMSRPADPGAGYPSFPNSSLPAGEKGFLLHPHFLFRPTFHIMSVMDITR